MCSERLLKIGDVTTLLGVTTQTLRNWANNGYMDAIIGKGGHRIFRRGDVERLMELKERESPIKKCFTSDSLLMFPMKFLKLSLFTDLRTKQSSLI